MALRPTTRKYTFPSNGSFTIASIMGKSQITWVGSIAIRAGRSNAQDVFWTDEQNEEGGYIGPAEAVTMEFGESQALLAKFMLKGTSGDVVYLTVGMNSDYYDYKGLV